MAQTVAKPADSPTPNHIEKQRQIVEAAKVVLARDGLAACTARTVADESPLTKSAIHYYFASMEDIVDEAMFSLLDEFLERVRHAGTESADPVEGFFAMANEYLRTFAEQPRYALLWFGYWVQIAEEGRTGTMRRLQDAIFEVLEVGLERAGVDDPVTRARAAFSYLIGAVLRQQAEPTPFDRVASELASICSLARL
jgi:AcrR family transcriptional regulator